jgi:hypothetical protein
MKKTPYQKILRAAERGTGLRLTAEEVATLAVDGAIQSIAWSDDEREEKQRKAKQTAQGESAD